jgi:hypothetical protein
MHRLCRNLHYNPLNSPHTCQNVAFKSVRVYTPVYTPVELLFIWNLVNIERNVSVIRILVELGK